MRAARLIALSAALVALSACFGATETRTVQRLELVVCPPKLPKVECPPKLPDVCPSWAKGSTLPVWPEGAGHVSDAYRCILRLYWALDKCSAGVDAIHRAYRPCRDAVPRGR